MILDDLKKAKFVGGGVVRPVKARPFNYAGGECVVPRGQIERHRALLEKIQPEHIGVDLGGVEQTVIVHIKNGRLMPAIYAEVVAVGIRQKIKDAFDDSVS